MPRGAAQPWRLAAACEASRYAACLAVGKCPDRDVLAGLGARQCVIRDFFYYCQRLLGVDAWFKGDMRNGVQGLVYRFRCLRTLHFRLPGVSGFLHKSAASQKGPVND